MNFTKLLAYWKYRVKNSMRQFSRANKFRLRGTLIQPGVQIAKGVKLHPSDRVGAYATLGEGVIVDLGVKIGSYAALSRIAIGEKTCIESRVCCTGYGNGKIIVGRESYIGIANILDWSDDITIGNYVHIAGPSTGLWTHSSVEMCLRGIPLQNKDKSSRPTAPIVIEDHVYIGGNCTIYPGITIGHHSVVAPNSAVTKSVEPYTMVGGGAAKVIKNIKEK